MSELRREIAAFLMARDENDPKRPVPDGAIVWGRRLIALGMKSEHSGDCGGEWHSCTRCLVERALVHADQLIALFGRGAP
jgi:hypothetical protein